MRTGIRALMVCMYRHRTLLLLTALFFGLAFSNAHAHETKIAGSMRVLLHMEPQDSPVIGEPARLFLAFSDDKGIFDITACDCELMITSKNKTVFEESLQIGDSELYGSNTGTAEFTFPKRGLYTVSVKADSKDGAFSPFALSYAVRIERENLEEEPVSPTSPARAIHVSPSYVIYVLGLLAFSAILYAGFKKK